MYSLSKDEKNLVMGALCKGNFIRNCSTHNSTVPGECEKFWSETRSGMHTYQCKTPRSPGYCVPGNHCA